MGNAVWPPPPQVLGSWFFAPCFSPWSSTCRLCWSFWNSGFHCFLVFLIRKKLDWFTNQWLYHEVPNVIIASSTPNLTLTQRFSPEMEKINYSSEQQKTLLFSSALWRHFAKLLPSILLNLHILIWDQSLFGLMILFCHLFFYMKF